MTNHRIYNSFEQLYNELPPPPDHLTNPTPIVRQADDRSLSDVSSLFSYTRHRDDSSMTDDELIRYAGNYIKRKGGQFKQAAKRKMEDTFKAVFALILDSVRQSAFGREAEDRELVVQMLQHPEWTDEEVEEARRRIYAKYDAIEQEEWAKYEKDPYHNKPPKNVGFLRISPEERKGGRF